MFIYLVRQNPTTSRRDAKLTLTPVQCDRSCRHRRQAMEEPSAPIGVDEIAYIFRWIEANIQTDRWRFL